MYCNTSILVSNDQKACEVIYIVQINLLCLHSLKRDSITFKYVNDCKRFQTLKTWKVLSSIVSKETLFIFHFQT